MVKMQQDGEPLKKFKKINLRTQVKRLRLTVDEDRQLDSFLDKYNLQYSDFNNSLIRNALRSDFHLVAMPDHYVRPAFPLKEKKFYRQPPKVSPQLMFELGRIGTNLNQWARALNVIKNDRDQELDITQQFGFLECLQVLQAIQLDIHSVIGEVRKNNMSETAIENSRKRVIKAVELVEDEADAH